MDKTLSNRGRTRDKKEKSFFVSVFTSTLIALAVGLLLLLASCFLGLSLDDPDKFTPPLALGSLFITAPPAVIKKAVLSAAHYPAFCSSGSSFCSRLRSDLASAFPFSPSAHPRPSSSPRSPVYAASAPAP